MSDTLLDNWKAPDDAILPNFIIGGAMKSGTSTLHAILSKHPRVFIPSEEIGFFDIDNLIEHYDFNFYDKKFRQWTTQEMSTHPRRLWQWYSAKFEKGREYLRGEDSTSYLASDFAARRIAIQEPPIKMLFMLRHPVKRAFSNYHHLVRSGIIAHSFEDVLQFYPDLVLRRSRYRDQLKAYYKYLPKDNIKVILFEDLISNPKAVIDSVCEFLNLDSTQLDASVFETHSNPGKFPLFARLHRLKNLVLRSYGNTFYQQALPNNAPKNVRGRSWFPKAVNKLHGLMNPLKVRKSPSMNLETAQFLETYFRKELAGLDELVGEEILSKWFPENQKSTPEGA